MSTRQKYADQQTYSTHAVGGYLPSVWDPEWVLRPRHSREQATGLRSKTDPRHIPDHLLMAADVQVAYRRARLTHEEKECLRHVHHLGFTPGELGSVWSVPSEDVHRAVMSGIAKVTAYLNGEVPA